MMIWWLYWHSSRGDDYLWLLMVWWLRIIWRLSNCFVLQIADCFRVGWREIVFTMAEEFCLHIVSEPWGEDCFHHGWGGGREKVWMVVVSFQRGSGVSMMMKTFEHIPTMLFKIFDISLLLNVIIFLQGYTPLGQMLVLLVFIISLFAIFGLIWIFVSFVNSIY